MTTEPVAIRSVVATEAVATDPEDPAIWIHPPAGDRSAILGANKVPAPGGRTITRKS